MQIHAQTDIAYSPAELFLSDIDQDWFRLIAQIGARPPLSISSAEPYQALIHAIAHQQLHGRAAEAILGRFKAMYNTDFPTAEDILNTDPLRLRECGFSATKITTIMGIAEKTIEGIVPPKALAHTLSNEELISRLTTLRGIGRWTVEIFMMHNLARPDILPVDDFGVREGWKILKALEAQPKPKELAQIGQAWSPYRSTAAWYLWRAVDRFKAQNKK
ncbi:DNA-3-methyladenine glycosylase family protein [Aquirhabdus parva]|uniref:DNA-3-methyladenine glycosylase II n=1 Tax=Aquirhabdus parva TaxID=2283318 RepID=A0A345P7F3_9GAMM|nr:DNA-3-methyladenine glycosylase [Aquirhabdus parva]AXI03212.1 DNA-3-methyladenine glycosylase 2 family protein [Aquirhabdus parva]